MRVALAVLASRNVVPLGMLYVASALREHGHQVFWKEARSARHLVQQLRRDRVDVVGFSATTGMHTVYLEWAAHVRRAFGVPTLFGGAHPTFVPEMIRHPDVDALVIGEAEHSVVELLPRLGAGTSREPIAGAWYKAGRGADAAVVRGPVRPPPQDLDALPSPAFDLVYDPFPRRARFHVKPFLASRGCAFRCTYCASAGYHALYGPKIRHLRLRSPAAVVREIGEVQRRWGLGQVWLADASLLSQASWAEELTGRIHRDIRSPFFCKVRPDHVTADAARMLASHGCQAAGMGVESGDDRIRREILGRTISREQIVAASRHLREAGIRVLTFSMLGIPTETFDDALKTVDLNVECRPDYAEATLLQPYPGTPLGERAVQEGWYDGDHDRIGYSYLAVSPFKYGSATDRDRIERLHKLLGLAVEFPEVRRVLGALTRLPMPRLHDALFRVWYAAGFGQRIHAKQDLQ
ncbi:MAG: B12-binding domain-containing radical SAM protein [Deltaproteobacteria bacterium]|nr:B12-binding domain-containing radical SAM protein [Deltaproteobacteria bacterium]